MYHSQNNRADWCKQNHKAGSPVMAKTLADNFYSRNSHLNIGCEHLRD